MSTQPDTNPELVDTFERLLRDYYHDDVLELAQHYPTQRTLTVDWMDLNRVDPDLAIDLVEQPDKILPYADEALRQYDIPVDVGFGKVSMRFSNLRQDVDITDLGRERYNNSLITVRGQVTQLSKIRQQAEELAFECQRCGTTARIPQNGSGVQEPHECQGCERQGPFQVNHGQSEFRNHQLVRIQKPPEGGDGAGRKIDVSLTEDQVTSISDRDRDLSTFFQVGDKLSLGIKQEIGDQVEGTDLFETQYDAHSYTVENSTFEDLDIDEHLDQIRAIANGEHGGPFDLLVDSINPDHYGDEKIKLAIGLQMFGGVTETTSTGARDRGDIHILLLGDPGSGKSTFLEAAKSIVPRSVKASGKGASAAGMTASAVQDGFGDSSEWTLKAGAMVQADQGLACVDEIDKMEEDAVSSMHDALESQTVSVNKAGINAELNARASLLAAGNPKYGRFDPMENVADQIDMDPPLMSRFDIMFMVNDQPDEETDRKVVNHILKSSDEIEPAIERDVLRAYIAHAQQTVSPKIRDQEVHDAIADFFIGFRNVSEGEENNPVPVTYRTVKGVERLAQASARVRLSDTVSLEDVQRATSLVETSMRQVGYDPEEGEFDVDIIETGMSSSQRNRVKSVKKLIEKLESGSKQGAPVDELINRAEDVGFDRNKVHHEIEKLKQKGEVYDANNDGEHLRST